MAKCFTKEGLAKLQQELEQLKKVERRKLAQEIAKAVAFGDLSENAAYKDAKEKKAFLEGRIIELEKMLANAQIIDKKTTGKVCLGSCVVLKADNQKMTLTLVSPQEADFDKGLISLDSPMGQNLLNKEKGETIEVATPSGKNIFYQILEIN